MHAASSLLPCPLRVVEYIISQCLIDLLNDFDQHLRIYPIGNLHQYLGLFVIIENPSILGLNQIGCQHARQPILVDLLHVFLVYTAPHVLPLDY